MTLDKGALTLKYFIRISALFLFASCTVDPETNLEERKIYQGPMIELENVLFYYSDSAFVKTKGITPHRLQYADGNQEFPKGLYLEFYDRNGKIESTIKANKAFFNKEKNEWLGQENVIVEKAKSNLQINTEELYWLPADEKIYTEKFVTIKREGEVLHGKGLEAKQNLSTYSITNPQGEFILKENKDL